MYTFTISDIRTKQTSTIEMPGNILRIGKSPDNELVLERKAISRQHCRIEVHNGALIVRDLGSRNGTFLDGRRLAPNTPVPFGLKQTIQIGDFALTVAGRTRNSGRPPVAPGAVRHPRAKPHENAAIRKADAIQAAKSSRRVTPVELKRQIHALLLERMDLKHKDMSSSSNEQLRLDTEQVCTQIVRELASALPSWLSPAALIKEIVDEAVGLGLLEDLLDEPDVDEIMVCGWDKIYVERRGKLELTDKQFTDNAQVIAIMRRILAPIGRRIDETSPMADGRLADGSRVNAIISPVALSGPTLTIRKFAKVPFTHEDLINRFHSITRNMIDFLRLAVQHRANILISGGTGSGKTTLLNIVSNFIPQDERIVTIEDAAELQLHQDHLVRLESRPPNIEGKNAIPIRELVRNSLRMRPDRIVVGECRGGEALDMLQAMNTGHDGSLTTLHANSPRDALSRLETLVLMAGMELPSRAIREQIASAINFIIQQSRMVDGSRKVEKISAVTGITEDTINLQDIFVFEQRGFDPEGNIRGRFKATGVIPDFVQTLLARGIKVDTSIFEGGEDVNMNDE